MMTVCKGQNKELKKVRHELKRGKKMVNAKGIRLVSFTPDKIKLPKPKAKYGAV